MTTEVARRAQLIVLGVGLGLGACAPSMKLAPLPCPETAPDVRLAANEVAPRPRQVSVEIIDRTEVTVYALIEPTGLVNPDSIMICGVTRTADTNRVAQAVAKSVFHPATRDGAPVRKWVSYTQGNTRR